jgi:NitT/TauT family transport system substrate-binding protein
VSEDLAEAAMASKASEFISDPHTISEQAATMGEFVADVGNIDEPVATENLFAFDPYDAIQE